MSTGRYIPKEIKREVRRQCGFGCVLCGVPVFHYDHINDFSVVREHTVENLALLCPTHHQNKTSGRLPREKVAKARENPYNLSRPRTSPDRWYFSGAEFHFMIGTNAYLFNFEDAKEGGTSRSAIRINGQDVFRVDMLDGEILLSAMFHDKVGRLILLVEQGEVVVSTRVFDYDIKGRHLTISDLDGGKLLDLHKLDDGIEVRRGFFQYEGTSLVIIPEEIVMQPMNARLSGTRFEYCMVGVNVNGPRMPRAANDFLFQV
ncbi:HNH endonuclease [Bordetella trematum]|uniref:HNH endonuclease n=1 Tax=Bordetella trematum TaxID=123899 RepID=UPI000D950CE5|nr:HNH endonuclease signature motif containing protein [Bordetella trematum]SPU54094.1 Uncharacterised protein [Bordetella trematum]VDH06608.1 Uncharacterised protein [Bordetella trematum]